MAPEEKPADILYDLRERAKELNCLYRVDEILSDPLLPTGQACTRIVAAIPAGWQYPHVCQAQIIFEGHRYEPDGFTETEWVQSADVVVEGRTLGAIKVYYTRPMPAAYDGPFLKEEARLIRTIADRLAGAVRLQRLAAMLPPNSNVAVNGVRRSRPGGRAVLETLRRTDRLLYDSICRRMLFYLCGRKVDAALQLYESWIRSDDRRESDDGDTAARPPHPVEASRLESRFSTDVVDIALEHLSEDELLKLIRHWLQVEKLSGLLRVVSRQRPLTNVADAVRRYVTSSSEDEGPSVDTIGVRAALIRRVLSNELEYVSAAKNYISVADLYKLMQRIVPIGGNFGHVGGKAAALYLATRILQDTLSNGHTVTMPRTAYITSDLMREFLDSLAIANLEEQKYKPADQIRIDYPHLEKTCRAARFPDELAKSLHLILDDFGDRPLVVRSSSLLQDRMGRPFPDIYPSFFLANQGSRRERLDDFLKAIARVYISVFDPEVIACRTKYGLLDFDEEMAVMIQEMVGCRIGPYFLPTFSGTALGRNDLSWLPSVRPSDGLLLLTPGIGTRAAIRSQDDCPVLLVPGRSGRPLYSDPGEAIRYSPKSVDLIDLESRSMRSLPLESIVRTFGRNYPGIDSLLSVVRDGAIRHVVRGEMDFSEDQFVATFAGLAGRTPYLETIQKAMDALQEVLTPPLALQFACDGNRLCLLRCSQQAGDGGGSSA